MASKFGMNVVFIFWDTEERDELRRVKRMFELSPKLQSLMPGALSNIGWVGPIDDKTPRMRLLDFMESTKSVSKYRRSADSLAQKIPYQIFYKVDQYPLADIVNLLKGGIEWPRFYDAQRPQTQTPAPAQTR